MKFGIIGFIVGFFAWALAFTFQYLGFSENLSYFLAFALGFGIKSPISWIAGAFGAFIGYQFQKKAQSSVPKESITQNSETDGLNKCFELSESVQNSQGSFIEKVKQSYFSSWQNAFTFKGKATRFEFWSFILLNQVFGFILGGLLGFFLLELGVQIANLLMLIYIVIVNAITARRLHDIGKSAKILWATPILVTIMFALLMSDGYSDSVTLITVLLGLLWLYVFVCTLLPSKKE